MQHQNRLHALVALHIEVHLGKEREDKYQEVEAVSTHGEGIVGDLQTRLVGMEEGRQAQHEGRVHRAPAALGALVVAGVHELALEVGVVHEGGVRQLAAAPTFSPKSFSSAVCMMYTCCQMSSEFSCRGRGARGGGGVTKPTAAPHTLPPGLISSANL